MRISLLLASAGLAGLMAMAAPFAKAADGPAPMVPGDAQDYRPIYRSLTAQHAAGLGQLPAFLPARLPILCACPC